MSEIDNSSDPSAALAATLRALTPARVALGRTGISLPTHALLDFQLSHAQARDAVQARLDAASLASTLAQLSSGPILRLHSAAPDRVTYLQRPDLGRKLDEPSRAILAQQPTDEVDLSIVIADGLSALAVERHATPLMTELLALLSGWNLAPITIVEQARVAIADEIASTLHAQISVILIGERPGLSSPDSLGAYITWDPRPGRTDAERNCISNIRAEGLTYPQAAAQLAFYLTEARRRRLSGIALKDETGLLG
jgi:ethanolamine ammonia-lyase small subunit